MTEPADSSAARTEVPAERVEAVIPLADIVRRVQQHAAAETQAEGASPGRTERLNRIGELAAELERELTLLDEPGE